MLAVSSIPRNLMMQEFSPCICVVQDSTAGEFYNFVSWRTTRPAGITELFMLPNPNTSSLMCILESILKMTGCIFCAKGNACVSREQLPPHRLTLQNTGSYWRPFVGLEGRSFLQLLTFSFTEPYWLFGNFSRPTSRSSPAWKILGVIWW